MKKNDIQVVILNEQGGSVMDVSEDITATLRAQDHGHPPVICFEPGILSRDCSAGNRAYKDICSTLRAQMGDNQPAVCYTMNERQISMMVRKNQANTIAATDYKGVQILCHEVKNEQREMPESMGCSK